MNRPRRTGDEGRPLLRKPARASLTRWQRHLTADVHRDWADIVLLLCYAITGLLDSSATSVWGAFVSMQTGNTVYIGLGFAAPDESTRWLKSLLSLVSFCIGSFLFSRFHRLFGPKHRWVLCASFTAQAAFTVAAAPIVAAFPTPDKEDVGWYVLVPIALVAFQSCGQAVTSRALEYNSLTSVVLTSIYCDLFSDVDIFAARNVERNRRMAAPLLLLLGAFVGGLFAHSPLGVAGALWTAAVLKLAVAFVWLLWPADTDTGMADAGPR
ncbi:hypothetical protein QBC46DRAFT_381405 [Diplogelasinospora grovesii]|uniref:DUF1275 domain protein n=1 Tax=Diplogelasinospora grovesii TaxID=303347 RepID=A0AAN6NAQ3_9PEZI|nr:hypothetical protein QBC46DRAFT_381405 [Diplogelasinospora grovesii]